MAELDDHQLLEEFARSGSEPAFAEIVGRYVNLVYSAALRYSNNHEHAGEITQAVFIILARKAGRLGRRTILSGWLYQTARLTASNFLRGEFRRQRHEQEAYVQSTLNESDPPHWQEIAPLLDEAMGDLGETDRAAVVLRFFENKTGHEIAAALNLSQDAAHKRVTRALDKLRQHFVKRGVHSSASLLSAAISAHAIHAAPAGLAVTISAAATKGAAAGSTTYALVKGALKIMAWSQMKTAGVVAVGILIATTATTVTVEKIHEAQDEKWQLGPMTGNILTDPPFRVRILPTKAKLRPRKLGLGGMRNDGDGRTCGINQPLSTLIRAAYSDYNSLLGPSRMVFDTTVPTNNYDFIANLPSGSQEALQQELRRKFGIACRFDTIETNVLILRVKDPHAAGLKPAASQNGFQGSSVDVGNGYLKVQGIRMPGLIYNLENPYFKLPVIDETGLTGQYDFTVSWDPADGDDGLKQALVDQLGLELVPAVEPVKMLVVARAK